MSAPEQRPVEAPDLLAPVLGFRQWRLTEGGLRSIKFDYVWREPTVRAECLVGDHPLETAPVSACSCGVYAWYTPCPRTSSAPTRDYVAGAVALWGAIELHPSGMRAEHSRIVALALPLSRWAKRDRVIDAARCFGVPAVRHRDLRAAAAQHGAPVPRVLRPAARTDCDLASVDRRRTADGQLVITPRGSAATGRRRC